MMDYCSCFYSNLTVFLLTLIMSATGVVYVFYYYREPLIEFLRTTILSVMRETTYGISDLVISSIQPILESDAVILQCDVTINIHNQPSQTYTHWIRYDARTAMLCKKLDAKLFGVTKSGERKQISYAPGVDLNLYAHELDPTYTHFIVNVKGEETVLDSQEQMSWNSVLQIDEETI